MMANLLSKVRQWAPKLKNMIDKSKVPKPYLVHTSPLSPPGVWEKFGCRKVKEIGRFNYVEKQ